MMRSNEGSGEYRERLANMNDEQLVGEIKTLRGNYGLGTQGLAGVLEILMRKKIAGRVTRERTRR